jgi:hypothetical protein
MNAKTGREFSFRNPQDDKHLLPAGFSYNINGQLQLKPKIGRRFEHAAPKRKVERLLLHFGAPNDPNILSLFLDEYSLETGKVILYPKPTCRKLVENIWHRLNLEDPEGCEIVLASDEFPSFLKINPFVAPSPSL